MKLSCIFKGHKPRPIFPDRPEVFTLTYEGKDKRSKFIKVYLCAKCSALYVGESE